MASGEAATSRGLKDEKEDSDDGSKPRVFRIVLTGGPCGGKTTALARLSDFFRTNGEPSITLVCPTEPLTPPVVMSPNRILPTLKGPLLPRPCPQPRGKSTRIGHKLILNVCGDQVSGSSRCRRRPRLSGATGWPWPTCWGTGTRSIGSKTPSSSAWPPYSISVTPLFSQFNSF